MDMTWDAKRLYDSARQYYAAEFDFIESEVVDMAAAAAKIEGADVIQQHNMAEALQYENFSHLHKIAVDRDKPHVADRADCIGRTIGLPWSLTNG